MSNGTAYVVALYIRLSTEDSKVGSFSIENQKRVLHQYVDAMEGVKNVDVMEFVDGPVKIGLNQKHPTARGALV